MQWLNNGEQLLMKSQNERLLEYLKFHGRINPLEAWTSLGIYRLGARIFDLRKSGLNIETNSIGVFNQFGEECIVAEYELMDE